MCDRMTGITKPAIRSKSRTNELEESLPADTTFSSSPDDFDVVLYLNDALSEDETPIKFVLLVLHAYDVTAKSTRQWIVDSNMHELNPHICFVFPQGQSASQSASMQKNEENKGSDIVEDDDAHMPMDMCSSWFEYTTDRDGKEEDDINEDDLAHSRSKILSLISRIADTHGVPFSQIGIMGCSQGGCMAVDVACHLSLKMCITLVGHKLSRTIKPLCTEWHALIAQRDDCFPLTWIKSRLIEAKSVTEIDDDHYLEDCDESNTYIETLLNLFFSVLDASEQVQAVG